MKYLIDETRRLWKMIPLDGGRYVAERQELLHKKIEWRAEPATEDTPLPQLPIMIVEQIVSFVVDWYLKNSLFRQAQLLMLINRNVLKKYYRKLCNEDMILGQENGWEGNEAIRNLHRLSNTLHFANTVFNFVLHSANPNVMTTFYYDMYVDSTFFIFPPTVYNAFKRFDLSVMDMHQVQIEGRDYDGETHFVSAGKRYGDVTWITGTYDEGMFNASRIEYPVIVLSIADENLSMTVEMAKTRKSWHKFVDLLKYVGGPNTAVYFVERVADEDTFIIREFV